MQTTLIEPTVASPAASSTGKHAELLEGIQKLGGRCAWLYSSQGQLDHYERLSDTLERFGDEVLTTAAFLHGLTANDLKPLESHVGNSALQILEEWRRLRELDPTAVDFGQKLREEVLPALQDIRSVLLLVYERLDRLDPNDRLADWARNFRRTPTLPVPHLPTPDQTFERFSSAYPWTYAEQVAAPIAEYWGLWQERNLIRNAVLYFQSSDRFLELATFAHYSSQQSWCQENVETIQERLQKDLEPEILQTLNFVWEWRHIASLSEQLRSHHAPQWSQKAHLCGFVSILCPDLQTCYVLLGKVHQAFEYKLDFFRDAMGKPTPSGYRALHTAVVDPREPGRLLAIRLVPKEIDEHRLDLAGPRYLEAHRQDLGVRSDEIQVFTPSGSHRFLPRGATVLNFATAIDKVWAAHVRGATINDQKVDVLHPLQQSDIVVLDTAGDLHYPPAGWEQQVPRDSVPRIREGLREAYRQPIRKAGYRYLLEKLGAIEIEESILDVFVESSAADLLKEHPGAPAHEVPWWIGQLGLLRLTERGHEFPYELTLKESWADLLVAKICTRIGQLRSLDSALDLDPQMLSTGVIQQCTQCNPGRRSALAGKVEGGIITIHRRGSRCAEGATAIRRSHLSLNQVYVVESNSRPGMVRDLAGIFAERKVNVIEFVARQLGSSWGVVRIEVEPIGPETVQTLVKDLKNFPTVHRVYGPDAEVPPFLLNALPPRSEVPRSLLSKPPPYVCGPVIYDHLYFYGREEEIYQLEQYFDRATSPHAKAGQIVFVAGALKVGKTSLVQRFQRRLELVQRDEPFPFLTLYHKTAVAESWAEAERKIAAQLAEKVSNVQAAWGQSDLCLDPDNLVESLRTVVSLENRPGIAIAIDEVVRLFKTSQEDPKQITSLHRFCDFVTSTPGLLLLWIGPIAPMRYLDSDVLEILDAAHHLPVRPLTVGETHAMLRAEKLAPIHQIEVPEEIARRIHRRTGGNPLWVAHIGYEIWKLLQQKSENAVRFTLPLVKQAETELIQLAIPFQGRILPSGYRRIQDRLMLATLFVLVEDSQGTRRRRRKMALAELLEALARRGIQAEATALERSLNELMARGGLSHPKKALQKWEIAAPLIEDFVWHQLKMIGWKSLLQEEDSTA